MNHIKNLDPNLRTLTATFELVFVSDDYSTTKTVEVHGNVIGFNGFSAALGVLYDELCAAPDRDDLAELTLYNAQGDELLIEIFDEDELLDVLVSAQLVATRPYQLAARAIADAQP